MEVRTTNTFFKSLKKMMDSENPLKFQYYREKWWKFRWILRNLRRYFKPVIHQYDFDFIYVLTMMKFQLGLLATRIDKGFEVDESRIPKVNNIKRVIELITNIEEDNFKDRCGYNDDAISINFVEIEDEENKGCYEIEAIKNPGFEDYNSKKILEDSRKLQEEEWKELFSILEKDMNGWWE